MFTTSYSNTNQQAFSSYVTYFYQWRGQISAAFAEILAISDILFVKEQPGSYKNIDCFWNEMHL